MNLVDLFAPFSVGAWFSKEDQVTSVHVPPAAPTTQRKRVRGGQAFFSTALMLGMAASAATAEVSTSAYVTESFIPDETQPTSEFVPDEGFSAVVNRLAAGLNSGLPLTVSPETLALTRTATQQRVDFRTISLEDWAKGLVESGKSST